MEDWREFILEHRKQFICGSLIGAVLLVAFLVFSWPMPSSTALFDGATSSVKSNKIKAKEHYIYVDVKGAVKDPGLHKLLADKHVR